MMNYFKTKNTEPVKNLPYRQNIQVKKRKLLVAVVFLTYSLTLSSCSLISTDEGYNNSSYDPYAAARTRSYRSNSVPSTANRNSQLGMETETEKGDKAETSSATSGVSVNGSFGAP
jgi:hypothetical protein